MGLGRCGPAKAGVPWRCSRTFIPQTAQAQSPFRANRGKSWLFPAPLPPGWLPERHPCIGTLGVLWWGVHKGWGLPDSSRTCVGRGPLVPRQWYCSYPRTPCGPPRTPETRTVQEIWVPSRSQGPVPWAWCRQAPAASVTQRLPAHRLLPLHRTPLTHFAHIPGHVVLHCRRVCFPGDLHAPPIGTGLPPWPWASFKLVGRKQMQGKVGICSQ